MTYYAKILKKDGAFIAEFPEFPNVITWGKTFESAIEMATDALSGALETDFERGFDFPHPVVHYGKDFHPIVVEVR